MLSQPVTSTPLVRIYLPICDLLFKLAVKVVIPHKLQKFQFLPSVSLNIL